ncbi:ead/Ea22-like family protein [Escherichia coli]|uniref:ead/Ea22-like family protein n=2 Tax=Escherichia coli TaxID=562 RepID=UPI0024073CDD|nr:ead/Ea22-like family protein [Escherichia coli]MDG0008562.1 ead/Ea22-like family protein [Escherichia coli]
MIQVVMLPMRLLNWCGDWSLEYGEGRFDGDDALIHREAAGYLPICRIEGAHPESGFDEDFQMEQQANAEFIAAANPATVLALLDELERKQQYIKRRDQENEDIALTVGKLRVELEAAKKRIAELEAEPVSQAYNLAELIEGMEVSIDVSTCDADLGNRYFGTVTEASELDTAKNGYILLVQDAEPNFDINGNSPVTPDGWISCSEQMPSAGEQVLAYRPDAPKSNDPLIKMATYVGGSAHGHGFDCYCKPTHWMPLPAAPQEVNRG